MVRMRRVDRQFWWGVVKQCEYATFFHTPLWHQLAAQTFPGYEDVTVGTQLENGTSVVLPLLKVGRGVKGLFRNCESTFTGCYGGLIADGPLSLSHRQEIYKTVCSHYRLGELCITDNPLLGESEGVGDLAVTRQDFTHLLRLGPGYETIESNFAKSNRKAVNRGHRNGIVTRVAATLREYQVWYDAYQDCLTRWGETATNRYPWALFENVYHLAQAHPEYIKLWVAELEAQVIGAVLVFYCNQHVVIWHSSSYEKYFPLGLNNVVRADIIKDACERGYAYFDFNPSGKHESVAQFKDTFGAERRMITHYYLSGKLSQIARSVIAGSRKRCVENPCSQDSD